MSSLKVVLSAIRKELTEKDKIREDAHKDMRKTTSLSKQTILLVHQKKMEGAKKLIREATEIIKMLKRKSTEYPEIIYGGMFNAALQEYAEANIFLGLVERSRFETPKKLDVPSVDYVLGLADVIGELRRFALDALRIGDIEKGEECLLMMDEIYVELMAMDEAYMLVHGLRRKCDVARKIIETTRGDITQEVRRSSLEKDLKRLEKQLAVKRKSKS